MSHQHNRRGFIKKTAIAVGVALSVGIGLISPSSVLAAVGKPEKPNLKFGFIKLTDMAPLAIAAEKGYFEDEGLYVTLEAQANWKVVLDRVIDGELDGSHMLAGQPLGTAVGFGTKADIITAFAMDINGKGTTVSNEVWKLMKPNVPHKDGKPVHPIKADALKPVLDKFKAEGKPLKLGMVFPVSGHNYELRYWLAAGGINPGYYAPAKGDTSGNLKADVLLSVTPPPQMPSTMESGTINGYTVGEPWNQQAVMKGIGVPVITSDQIWKTSPDKVFGVNKKWAEKNPNTHIRVVKALIRASKWLDEGNNKNRIEASKLLSKSQYVGADASIIDNSMTGTFEYERGDKRAMPDFNAFFRNNASYPYYSDAVWTLTQMRRWGQIPDAKTDNWYMDMAKNVYRPDIYAIAAKELIAEGKMKASDFPSLAKETGFRAPQKSTLDGVTFDGRKPNDYLKSLKIGLKGNEKP